MPYITFYQMETGRVLGTPNDPAIKIEWLEYAFEHHASCDMLKMLDDLPLEVFERDESVVES